MFDSAVAFASMLAAFRLTPASGESLSVETHAGPTVAAAVFAVVALVMSFVFASGQQANFRSRHRVVLMVLIMGTVMMGTSSLVFSFILYKQIGRYIVAICALLFMAVEAGVRLAWYRKIRLTVHRLAVWGDDVFASQIVSLVDQASFRLEVACVISSGRPGGSPVVDELTGHGIHEVVIDRVPAGMGGFMLDLMDRGIAVSGKDAFAERHFAKVPCAFIDADWFFQIDLKNHHPFYYSTKRIMDIGLSLVGGVVSSPLLLAAILAIRLSGRGPVFYSQVRVGLRQKEFTIWKLRTMVVDSERSGAQWAIVGDPRITAVGRILRKTRIDEIPQFFNILRGDMTFVGPRPERPEFVDQLARKLPFYRQRHLIKPGLTGWAQISYRYGASDDDAREKLAYDLYYLKNASLMLDLQILLQTVGAISRGSR